VCNARHTSIRGAQRRAGGAGNSLFLGIGGRAWSIGTSRCIELLAILREYVLLGTFPQSIHPPCISHCKPQMSTRTKVPQEPLDTAPAQVPTHARPRTAGRHSVTQPPTCPPTQRGHVSASLEGGPDQRTPPTRGARHRLPARMPLPRLPPLTHAAPAHPARRNGPNAPAPRMHPVGPRK